MSESISLVVTDLDGTLWHTDDRTHPDVIAAVNEVERRGVPVLVATGRRVSSARSGLSRAGLALPAVVLNGALGLDLTTEQRFHRAPFDSADAISVLDAFQSAGVEPVVYVDDPDVAAFLPENPSTNPAHAHGLLGEARIVELANAIPDTPVLGFSVIGVDMALAELALSAIGDRAETHLDRSLDYPGKATLTVAPLGQSKWDGVLAFCAHHELDPTRVLALADGANDLELLDAAAVSLVPAVAHEHAIARADHIIPAAADGGWAAVLDHI